MINPFPDEIFPLHIVYVLNNESNKISLTKILGNGKFYTIKTTYIAVNLKDCTWFPSLDFTWLYRNQPELNTIEEINILFRKEKIKKIKDGRKRNN
jgi:hypothetical protein